MKFVVPEDLQDLSSAEGDSRLKLQAGKPHFLNYSGYVFKRGDRSKSTGNTKYTTSFRALIKIYVYMYVYMYNNIAR